MEIVGLYWVKVDRKEWDRLFIELMGAGGGGEKGRVSFYLGLPPRGYFPVIWFVVVH